MPTKKLGLHRVDGRSYWFAGYFNRFDRDLMVRYAGQFRADRFNETFGGKVPFADATIVKVFDPDPVAAQQFADTFHVPVAATLDEFGDGLDGVIVPFPSGGHARDYNATAPLIRRGIPLFLDRIILEQTDLLRDLCRVSAEKRAPLQVTAFTRYVAELLYPLPEAGAAAGPVRSVVASVGGDPVGYGADLLDLVDQLMGVRAVSVLNTGDARADILRITYEDGRHAILHLLHNAKPPMQATALGDGWARSVTLDGTQNHLGALRQFEAFLESIQTRQPPVPYERLLANAEVLRFAEKHVYGQEQPVSPGM